MTKTTVTYKGASALLGSAFIFSTFGLLIRQLAEMFSFSGQVTARLALASTMIAGIVFIRRHSLQISRRDAVAAVALGVAFTCSILFFTISVSFIKIATAVSLLYATTIIASMIIGVVVFRERPTLSKWLAVAVAACGLCLYTQDIPVLGVGLLAGLAAGLLEGVSNALRKTVRSADRWTVLLYQYGTCAGMGSLLVVFSGEPAMHGFNWLSLLALLTFACLQVLLGSLLLYGFKHFDVSIGTVTLSIELFFAMLLGFLFLHETPTLREFVAVLCVFAASMLSAVDVRQLLGRWKQRPEST